MYKIVRVLLRDYDQFGDFFIEGDESVKRGDYVIAKYENKETIGRVVREPVEKENISHDIKSARLITNEELSWYKGLEAKEREAKKYCQQRSDDRNLGMNLVRVKWFYDGSKIIFYFTSDGRVDFRDLVKKDLAPYYKTRIELRQIGVRDEAKLLGGIGVCGRELCCSKFLKEFKSISVKMAKVQNLQLNPTKVSGVCGRLMCCLQYEYDTYLKERETLPFEGQKVIYNGEEFTVTDVNVIKRVVNIANNDKRISKVKPEELKYDKIKVSVEDYFNNQDVKMEDK